MDNETVRSTLRAFRDLPENSRPNIEITLLENEEAQIETINLIRPRLHERIPFTIEPRTTISYRYVWERMVEAYDARRDHLRRILPRE